MTLTTTPINPPSTDASGALLDNSGDGLCLDGTSSCNGESKDAAYRATVLRLLPNLRKLDGKDVTAEEVAAAQTNGVAKMREDIKEGRVREVKAVEAQKEVETAQMEAVEAREASDASAEGSEAVEDDDGGDEVSFYWSN